MLDVCLLGTAGTIPLPRRRLSAALVRVGGSLVLLDCGEGTQNGNIEVFPYYFCSGYFDEV